MKTLIATCLVAFLANIAFATAAGKPPGSPARPQCPQEESAQERDLVLTEGPLVVEGRKASVCLQRIIDREKKNLGSTEDDREFLVGYMSAVWKAEYQEIEGPL